MAAQLSPPTERFDANPDLVARLRQNGPFNATHAPTVYGGDAHGYTDYPIL